MVGRPCGEKQLLNSSLIGVYSRGLRIMVVVWWCGVYTMEYLGFGVNLTDFTE
jgi:hypothetical protein